MKPVIRKDKKAQEEKPLPLIKGNKCVITTKNGKEVRKEILEVKGDILILKTEKSVKISDAKCLMHTGGWVRIS